MWKLRFRNCNNEEEYLLEKKVNLQDARNGLMRYKYTT